MVKYGSQGTKWDGLEVSVYLYHQFKQLSIKIIQLN